MLAYATHRRTPRQLSPSTLLVIVGVHAVALAMVAAAKMDIDIVPRGGPTKIIDIPLPPPPTPPKPVEQRSQEQQPAHQSSIDRFPPITPLPIPGPEFAAGPTTLDPPDLGPILDKPIGPPAQPDPPPVMPVKVAARAITPADLVRPPYPDSKRRSEEEAALRLRLSIDERGRVTAVEPIGAADPDFLAAARSHLLRFWRYRPATEDGRAVATSMVITLRFQLEE
ncbi:energy transducer TonB [Sphingomonas astaxanthinifaciens]|uniref:TonB C-terminal domain-containing protein n=1 Tax=Sphingomonas astaxanthinifaciens DSM 22298 TaxID=1123267 RepID=A0ABQ5Z461_9SPHN|nr:energy transducer TonB [Sphingomonas astaxanthinifaciens]GLR46791.1 hypothetical protein GCM10007925_05020 [Sphingomonas astaxanthinifaciens DSM 22298]